MNSAPAIQSHILRDLHIDEAYVRPICPQFAEEAAAAFDQRLFGQIHVSRRADGSLWIVDGRRRLEIVRALFGPEAEVICFVRELKDVAEEATAFILCNACRVPLSIEEQLQAARLIETGGPKGEAARVRLLLNTARENLSLEDLRRAQKVAGLTDEELQTIVAIWPES
jgi:hypothetical protein